MIKIVLVMDAIVLLSGGQDSATCLAIAKQRYTAIHCICFDYGQRHRIEIDCSKQLAALAGASFQLIDATFLAQLTSSAMVHRDVPMTRTTDPWPRTFVPGRNALFLTIAATVAYESNCSTLVTGVCQTDYSGYPDCREVFIDSQAQTLSLAMDRSITIDTPLMHLTKAQTVLKMAELGLFGWYANTHTCYDGKRPACGVCDSCTLRLAGFKAANMDDPIAYELTAD